MDRVAARPNFAKPPNAGDAHHSVGIAIRVLAGARGIVPPDVTRVLVADRRLNLYRGDGRAVPRRNVA